ETYRRYIRKTNNSNLFNPFYQFIHRRYIASMISFLRQCGEAAATVAGVGWLITIGLVLHEGGPVGSVIAWVVAASLLAPFLLLFAWLSRSTEVAHDIPDYCGLHLGRSGRMFATFGFIALFISTVPLIAWMIASFLGRSLQWSGTAVLGLAIFMIGG